LESLNPHHICGEARIPTPHTLPLLYSIRLRCLSFRRGPPWRIWFGTVALRACAPSATPAFNIISIPFLLPLAALLPCCRRVTSFLSVSRCWFRSAQPSYHALARSFTAARRNAHRGVSSTHLTPSTIRARCRGTACCAARKTFKAHKRQARRTRYLNTAYTCPFHFMPQSRGKRRQGRQEEGRDREGRARGGQAGRKANQALWQEGTGATRQTNATSATRHYIEQGTLPSPPPCTAHHTEPWGMGSSARHGALATLPRCCAAPVSARRLLHTAAYCHPLLPATS